MWWCDNIVVIVLLQILFFIPKLNISTLIFNSCLRKCSTMKWMFVIFHTKSKQLMSFLSLCLFLIFFFCVTCLSELILSFGSCVYSILYSLYLIGKRVGSKRCRRVNTGMHHASSDDGFQRTSKGFKPH